MNVLIVEDENMAAKRLEKLLLAADENTHILAQLDSVKTATAWLSQHTADLLFFDIQLADGLSFEILEQVEVKAPIIFTTAFDEYAIQAFKFSALDYLLKPFDPEDVRAAFSRARDLKEKEEIQLKLAQGAWIRKIYDPNDE